MQTQPAPTATRHWYIQVETQAYGPFDDAALWGFMNEGRVSAQSLISNSPATGYSPVSANPTLMNWLAQVPGIAQKTVAPAQTMKPSVFLVMGEIRSGRGMQFLQTLQGLGRVQRVGDTLWLLQARASADMIRDVLGQPLDQSDRLFVMDAFENETAWFNLSPDMDSQIAEIWDVDRG